MIDRTTKLRWRRRFRRSRKHVDNLSQQTEENLDKHLFRRLSHLTNVRRFLVSWTLLLVLLSGLTVFEIHALSTYYQTLQPIPGGTYEEGMVGNYTNSNPLFATSTVDTSVSKLIYAGLFQYNQQNQFVGNLASSIVSDSEGLNYTVTLNKNLKWQDGAPLTAADVVFTYQTIQNPNVDSPLFSSFEGVGIKALNNSTILFTLPDPLSSFPYSLTNGIIPKHLLQNIPAPELRTANFDTLNPVGSGPFKWAGIQVTNPNNVSNREDEIGLVANPLYIGGKPKLNNFNIDAFTTQTQMLTAFKDRSINAMVGLNNVPANLRNEIGVYEYNIPLTAEVMVFFRNSQALLSDVNVRQALVESINESSVIDGLGYPVVASKSPLLPFQVGYNSSYLQLPTNTAAAETLLNSDGWIVGKNGVRYKNGQALQFQLVTQDTSDYNYVASALSEQWRKIGANVQVVPEEPVELQSSVANHDYDSLLYTISIGIDPDVFVYWDSSQITASPSLNFSEYKSTTADQSLESGRTVINPELRAIKYAPFLQSWQSDAPALALYQPRFLYITRGEVFGFSPTMINQATDRFNNVQNWMINEVKVTNS